MDLNTLTPVEKIGDLYFKRDDLFKPFNNNGTVANYVNVLLY